MIERAFLVTENTDLSRSLEWVDRLYFGDQYCEHNHLALFSDAAYLDFIRSSGLPLTLTTPPVSETWLPKVFEGILSFADLGPLEVVVNDYGVFARLLKLDHPNISIIWGNFLSGQNKDPYLDLFKDKSTHEHITIDNAYFAKIFAKHDIRAFELYHVFQWLKIDTLTTPRHLYTPYVVYSLTRYCVPALLSQGRDYLTIVEDCPGCTTIVGEDLTMELKIGEEKVANIYRWNRQFYRNPRPIEESQYDRIIDNSDLACTKA